MGYLYINPKINNFLNFGNPKEDEKSEVFDQGTYEAQNSIIKTSVCLYFVRKGFSKIYLLERE